LTSSASGQIVEEPHNEGEVKVMFVWLAYPIAVELEAVVENLNSNQPYLWSREGLADETVQLREAP